MAGFGVRNGFHQRHVGVEDVFQNVFGVAGGADAQHFKLRALILDLSRSFSNMSMVSWMGLPLESW